MAFFLGVIFGVLLTLGAIYGSIVLYLYEPEQNRNPGPKEREHGMQPGLSDYLNSRDAWLNHLINFLYREFCNSDILHNFALRKLNYELEEIRAGPAARFLSKLELKDYKFGTRCPVLTNFRLAEPEGFDSDVLPDAISIEFDVDYNVADDPPEEVPFFMSAEAVPVLFASSIEVSMKVLKVKGRLRIHLSRNPVPFWYASFVTKPELELKVQTSGITSKISTTVENLFTTHMQRLVQRRHTIPKFKVRHSPFFSPEHFFLRKVAPTSDLPVGFINFNFGAAALEITALRGRGFPCRHSDNDPPSSCFVSFNLSTGDWDEFLQSPGASFAASQTEKEETANEMANDGEIDDQRYDEFVNISIAKTRNLLVTEDETESDIEESSKEQIPVQVGRESRRARMFATYKSYKELAKERVKERIEPVLKHRKRTDTNASSTKSEGGIAGDQSPRPDSEMRNSDHTVAHNSAVPAPSSAPFRRKRGADTPDLKPDTENASVWQAVAAQKDFYRTKIAPRIQKMYRWRFETLKADIAREHSYILIAVWEKPHGVDEPIQMGQLSVPLDTIYAKTSQTLGNKFVRKLRLRPPRDFDVEQIKDCVGDIGNNRGFRREMAFGEVTIEVTLTTKEEREKEKEHLGTQTEQTEPTISQTSHTPNTAVVTDSTIRSHGRNLIGNIKNKFWTDKAAKKDVPNVSLSTPEPVPKFITDRSRSDSHLSLKSNFSNINLNEQNSEGEEFFAANDIAQLDDAENEVEIGILPDERDAHLVNDVQKHYPGHVAKNPLDSLAVIAKQEGQKLHRDLPERERRDTIEQQISKIEIEIDAEVGRKKQLESDLRSSTPIGIKTSGIEKNLEKCKERLNALTMLSMSYQAGMTDADTPED